MPPSSYVDTGPGRLFHENNMGFQTPKFSRTMVKTIIFAVVFLLTASICLTYTFMRPAIYESSADLLLTPDLPGGDANMEGGAAIQDVAVQSQVLLSRELLTRLFEKLTGGDEGTEGMPADMSALKNMVRVTQVENSTIVKLRAEGPEKDVLPIIVNTWLDLYLQKNSQIQTSNSNAASDSLQRQILELENKIAEKEEELNKFRDQYDIVSMQRDENQVLSQLKGLNTALNNAVEKKVAVEANLIALTEMIEKGTWAGRFRKPNELIALEKEAETLQELVTEYEARYTPKYLQLDKDARAAIEKLERLEEKILVKYEENRISAIEEAEQEIMIAEQAVKDIEEKLSSNKKKAAMFSRRLSELESLQNELAQLKTLYNEMKEALVTMEIKSSTDIVQVKLLERAFPTERPIRPNYLRDAALSIALSILVGLLSVICFELFTRPTGGWSETRAQAITYNQLFQNAHPLLQVSPGNRQEHGSKSALEHKLPRELAETEVQALMAASDSHAQLLIAAILNGLSLKEAARLKWGDINWESKNILIAGENARTIIPAELFLRILEQNMPGKPDAGLPVFQNKHGNSLTDMELESLIIRAANDAGLDLPLEITSQVLQHTYISYLVRQGGRLEEIEQMTGPLSASYKAVYALIKPPGPGTPLAEIELAYPLRNPQSPA